MHAVSHYKRNHILLSSEKNYFLLIVCLLPMETHIVINQGKSTSSFIGFLNESGYSSLCML